MRLFQRHQSKNKVAKTKIVSEVKSHGGKSTQRKAFKTTSGRQLKSHKSHNLFFFFFLLKLRLQAQGDWDILDALEYLFCGFGERLKRRWDTFCSFMVSGWCIVFQYGVLRDSQNFVVLFSPRNFLLLLSVIPRSSFPFCFLFLQIPENQPDAQERRTEDDICILQHWYLH